MYLTGTEKQFTRSITLIIEMFTVPWQRRKVASKAQNSPTSYNTDAGKVEKFRTQFQLQLQQMIDSFLPILSCSSLCKVQITIRSVYACSWCMPKIGKTA